MSSIISPSDQLLTIGTLVRLSGSGSIGRVVGLTATRCKIKLLEDIAGNTIADGLSVEVGLNTVEALPLDQQSVSNIDSRIKIGRQFAFNQMQRNASGKIALNIFGFVSALAVIFGNDRPDPGAPAPRQVTMKTHTGNRAMTPSEALFWMSQGLLGNYDPDRFQTFLDQLDALKPWDNNHECITNITSVVVRNHSKDIFFVKDLAHIY